jgi:hypothetical protein
MSSFNPLSPAIVVISSDDACNPLSRAMSGGHRKQSEVLTLPTSRLQRRFVPDKKAGIAKAWECRGIPWIPSSVAQPTQSVTRRNDQPDRHRKNKTRRCPGLDQFVTICVKRLYLVAPTDQ